MRFLVIFPLVLSIISCEPIPKKPNVVFILVDDLGWADLGYMGSTFYETPELDKFSKQSVNFTNAYSSGSVCSPSRAAILTGRHPVRLQITDWIPGMVSQGKSLSTPGIANELALEEVTLAERLRQNGYKTFFAGKWHLGDTTFYPEDQGFDTNVGGHDKGSPPGGYYTPYKNPKLDDGPEGEYLTDRLTNESLQFLDNIGEDPFMLYLSFYTVHTPIQANKQYIEKFEGKLDTLKGKEPRTRAEGAGITRLEQNDPAYASMVYAMDQNVGRIIKKLKDRGLFEHTIIVFTSDNGGLSTLDKNRKNPGPTSVLPLRGGKGWLYEGGIRVPLLYKPLYYKGGAKVVDAPVIGHDFFPTILSQMELALPEDLAGDGIDFTHALNHPEQMQERDLVWHYPHYHGSGWAPGSAIRSGKWKLIEFYETGKVELYDLKEDIGESNDISELLPKKTEALRELLHAQLDSMNASYTTPAN
ncbi:MAG: sulfatase [Cyclobacteriaceae bacterium]|nr:sulfatase [Cyclobacteriaceae bacterium SS2]